MSCRNRQGQRTVRFNVAMLLRRGFALVMLVLTTGCTTWQPRALPATWNDEDGPLRVHLATGEMLEVRDIAVRDDTTLVGTAASVGPSGSVQNLTIPLGQVRMLEVRRTSWGRTILLLVAVPTLAIITFAAAIPSCDQGGC